MSQSQFTVKLTAPDVARRCVRCGQLITFDWLEYPVVDNRRNMRVVAMLYAHPSVEGCRADIERASCLVAGERPSPYDIGMQRAALLRELVATAEVALLEDPDPDLATVEVNYAKRKRGPRERVGVKPYGGLL